MVLADIGKCRERDRGSHLFEANSIWLQAAAFDKKNQAYLISHRNGLLLFVCAK